MKSETKQRIFLYSVIALVVLSVFTVPKLSPSKRTITIDDCFDTISDITIYSMTNKPLSDCKKYMNNMNTELSPDDSSGTIYKLNNGLPAELSDDVQELLQFGKDFSSENPDFFSIYLYPLEKVWNVKNNTGYIPDVQPALAKAQEQNQISLGAIAKGYITDRLVEILEKDGVKSALINLGGNTYALGTKPDGSNWKIGIQDPKDENNIIGTIKAENLAVITSGDYQRYFELNGKRYHHIFDPKTGFPSDSGLHSVTIISDNAALADALSTAIFVAGKEKGQELLKKYDARGIFITDDTVYFSKSLEKIFKQQDFSYKYEFMY